MSLLTPRRSAAALLLSLALLPGCITEDQICALLGDWKGAFYGDAEGDLVISIIDSDTPDEAIIQITLKGGADLTTIAEGTGVIGCTDGEIALDLVNADDEVIGDFAGTINDDGSSEAGEWHFATGESGTWDAALE